MKYDEILEKIGEFGPYQKRIYFLLCLASIACGFQAFIPVVHLATPNFRCALTDYPNDTYEIQSHAHAILVNRSIPWVYKDFRYKYDTCHMLMTSKGNDTRNVTSLDNDDTQNVTSANNATRECDEWVYDRASGMKRSVVSQSVDMGAQMDVVCNNKVQRSHMKMAYLAGKLAGSMVMGPAADYLGRKKILVLSCLMQFVVGLGNAFVSDPIGYSICRFFIGVTTSGLFISAFVLGMELVGKTKRMWAGIVIEFFFAIGEMILAGASYLIRDWAILQILISIPAAFFLLYWWFMPESARWLVTQGRIKDAIVILDKVAKVNGTQLPENLDLVDEERDSPKPKLWNLCSSKKLVSRTAVIFFNWAVVAAVYYGLTLNSDRLHENLFLGFFLSAVVEFIGYALTLLLIDRIGRKWLHTSMMLLGGAANLCTIFSVLYGGQDLQWITMLLALIGKLAVSAAFAVIYLFTTELFPTVLRTSALGTSSTVSRIGGIISPYIADIGHLIRTDFGQALPLIVFGAFSLAAGILALFLPETLNQPLPDTINDAKNMGKSGWRIKDDDPSPIVRQPLGEGVEMRSFIT